jgi:hypothetical protein
MIDRADAAGIGISLAGHAALLALLSVALFTATSQPPMPPAMEVSYVEDIGLVSGSPNPAQEPAAQATAPDLGPVEDAAPAPSPGPAPPAPVPTPRQALPAPAARPVPPRPAARPAPPAPAAAQRTRRPGLGDLNPNAFGRDPNSQSSRPPAAAMSSRAAADIGQAIIRQVQPCADRQVDPGPGANRIVTTMNLRLNRDGSLASRPRVVRQSGLDDENRRYAQRVADIAIAAFTGCSPMRGLPAELYDVPRGWSNFTLNYRLPG